MEVFGEDERTDADEDEAAEDFGAFADGAAQEAAQAQTDGGHDVVARPMARAVSRMLTSRKARPTPTIMESMLVAMATSMSGEGGRRPDWPLSGCASADCSPAGCSGCSAP